MACRVLCSRGGSMIQVQQGSGWGRRAHKSGRTMIARHPVMIQGGRESCSSGRLAVGLQGPQLRLNLARVHRLVIIAVLDEMLGERMSINKHLQLPLALPHPRPRREVTHRLMSDATSSRRTDERDLRAWENYVLGRCNLHRGQALM